MQIANFCGPFARKILGALKIFLFEAGYFIDVKGELVRDFLSKLQRGIVLERPLAHGSIWQFINSTNLNNL